LEAAGGFEPLNKGFTEQGPVLYSNNITILGVYSCYKQDKLEGYLQQKCNKDIQFHSPFLLAFKNLSSMSQFTLSQMSILLDNPNSAVPQATTLRLAPFGTTAIILLYT